jgi:hypothetical protein
LIGYKRDEEKREPEELNSDLFVYNYKRDEEKREELDSDLFGYLLQEG